MLTDKVKILLPKVSVEALLLTLLFSISLTMRLYLLFEFDHHLLTLHEADAMGYFAIARSIFDNWGLGNTSTHFPPFYPFVIGVVCLFSGDIEIAGRVASSIMGALLVFPVYLIGRELYDKRAGFLSAVVVVFFQPFVDASLAPLSQTTYLTLLTTAVYLGIVLIKKPPLMLHLFLGLTLGATYLTRPEGIVVFVFFLVMISIALFFNSNTEVKEKFKRVFVLMIGFLILALPYVNYLHKQTETWTISGKAATTIIGVDASARLLPDGKTVGESMRGKMGISNAFPSIQGFLDAYWQNIKRFEKVLLEQLPVIYLLFALLGLFILLISIFKAQNDSKKIFQLLISLGGFVAVLPVFVFSNLAAAPSYILPVFPILIVLFSVGLIYMDDVLMKAITSFGKPFNLKKWPFISAVVVVVFSYTSFLLVWDNLNSRRHRHFQMGQVFLLKDTGEWLKYNTPKDAVIMSRWSNIGFYADRKWLQLPDGEIPEVIKYAKAHDVRYIIIDSDSVPERLPKLFPLLVTTLSDDRLLKEAYSKEKFRIRVIIYEVL